MNLRILKGVVHPDDYGQELPQQILQFPSVFLRTVLDVNVAIPRGHPIGILFSLPMFSLCGSLVGRPAS